MSNPPGESPGSPQHNPGPGHTSPPSFGAPLYGPGRHNPSSGGYPQQQPPNRPGNLPLIIGAIVLALTVLAGAIFLLVRPEQEPAQPEPLPPTGTASAPPTSPANGSPPAASQPPAPGIPSSREVTSGTVGQPVTFQASTGSGTWTVIDHEWQDEGLIPPQQGTYLVLDIEIECVAGSYSYASLYFKGVLEDGREFTMSFGDRGNVPKLGVGTLQAGEKTRGYVVLDLPRGETRLMMTDLLSEISWVTIPGN